MAKTLTIGVPLIADTWLGGVNYILHLFLACKSLPKDIQPKVLAVVPKAYVTPTAIEANKHALALANGIVAETDNLSLAQELLGPKVRCYTTQDELFNLIDFYYPVQSDALPNRPVASWIPDFQHKRLPQFFSEHTIALRDANFQLVADTAEHIVFSSKAAQQDFKRFYPESLAKQHVLHFSAVAEETWYQGDPEATRLRYNLPQDYLMCCNQFWVHKDHRTLFAALALLKKQGHPLHLVCTGPTKDHRYPNYFRELVESLSKLGIDEQVHILGTIDREDQIQLLRGSLGVVQPSLFEGWSTVVEDCRVLGKTIFLTDIDVHEEQNPEHGIFFKAGDPADLALKIMEHTKDLGATTNTEQEAQGREQGAQRTTLFGLTLLRIAQMGAASSPKRGLVDQPSSAWPKITIVTPSFNQGEYIERTICSIVNQGYPNLEYMIFDGGSTDQTVAIIRKYHKQIDYWVSKPDNGQSDAIDKGLAKATGEIFNWINSDDWLEPGALFRVAKAWRDNPQAGGWVGACRRMAPTGEQINIIFPNSLGRSNLGENWNGKQIYQPACFISTKLAKQFSVDVGLTYCMDQDLYFQMLEHAPFVCGQGIWADALIHANAKTTADKDKLHREVIKLQIKRGFIQGAKVRQHFCFEGGAPGFVVPKDIQERLAKLQNPLSIEGLDLTGLRIAMVNNFLPRHDISSAQLRILELVRILVSAGAEVTFWYFYGSENDEAYAKDLGIQATRIAPEPAQAAAAIAAAKPQALWLTNLWATAFLQLQTEIMQHLQKLLPQAQMIMDTMDVHSRKYLRKYVLSHEPKDMTTAQEFLALEAKAYPQADAVVVVSPDEKKALMESVPHTAPVTIIPNIHRPVTTITPMAMRKDLVFLGNYDIAHNQDAARYLVTTIFPHITALRQDIYIHFVGAKAKEALADLASPFVRLVGFVPDLAKTLSRYRVFVCPMTYGSGLKGKIGMAAAQGLPIVTTSIGAEGFGFTDGTQCFVSDDPIEFAHKTMQVYDDRITWHNFSFQGVLAMGKWFSPRPVSQALGTLLNSRKYHA